MVCFIVRPTSYNVIASQVVLKQYLRIHIDERDIKISYVFSNRQFLLSFDDKASLTNVTLPFMHHLIQSSSIRIKHFPYIDW